MKNTIKEMQEILNAIDKGIDIEEYNFIDCEWIDFKKGDYPDFNHNCYRIKKKQTKTWRPFKDTDELIEANGSYVTFIKSKNSGMIWLIVMYSTKFVRTEKESLTMDDLFRCFTFVDGRTLGVEECSTSNEVNFKQDSMDNFNPSTVKIGNKLWMAENLKYDDGEEGITYNPDNKEYYYTYEAAERVAKKLGWKLPTSEDWNKSAEECGAKCTNPEEKNIKRRDYDGKNLKSILKVELTGFYDECFYVGNHAFFWASSKSSSTLAYYRYFNTIGSMFSDTRHKNFGLSIRLVKDVF